MRIIEMPGGRRGCPGRKPKDVGAVPVAVFNSRQNAIVAWCPALKSKQQIIMQTNDNDFDYAPREGLEEAECFSAMLTDFFVGAARGGDLSFSPMGLCGLTNILRTITENCGAAREQLVAVQLATKQLGRMAEKTVN